MNEKIMSLAFKQIRDELLYYIKTHSYAIEDKTSYYGYAPCVNADEIENLIKELFDGIVDEK